MMMMIIIIMTLFQYIQSLIGSSSGKTNNETDLNNKN